MSTFGDVLSVVQNNLSRSDTATNALIIANYNLFCGLLANANDWPELDVVETGPVVAGTYEYSLPNDWQVSHKKLHGIKLHDGTKFYPPLRYVLPERWDEELGPQIHQASRRPEFYTEYVKGTVLMFPNPNEAYTAHIKYVSRPTKAATISTPVSFDDSLLEVIQAATTALTWISLEEEKNAAMWMKVADIGMKSHKLDLNKVLNYKPIVQPTDSGRATPQTWADPFSRR